MSAHCSTDTFSSEISLADKNLYQLCFVTVAWFMSGMFSTSTAVCLWYNFGAVVCVQHFTDIW